MSVRPTLCLRLNSHTQAGSKAGGLEGLVVSHKFFHSQPKPRCLWLRLFQQITCKFQRDLVSVQQHFTWILLDLTFFFSTNTAKARTISSHQIRYDRSSVRNYVQLALLWWVTKEAIRSFKSLACKLLPMKIIRLYYIPQHLLHDSFLRVFTYFDWKLNYIISYFRHHMMCIKLILNNNLVLL